MLSSMSSGSLHPQGRREDTADPATSSALSPAGMPQSPALLTCAPAPQKGGEEACQPHALEKDWQQSLAPVRGLLLG